MRRVLLGIGAWLLLACAQQPASTPLRALSAPALVFDWQIGASEAQLDWRGLTMLDVDGFNTSAATVARMRAAGVTAVCYLDVGSWEPGRPDSARYPAHLKLQRDPDWPQEYFLDIRDVFRSQSSLAPLLRERFRMCADKGFAWIEPDNLQNDENVRGKKITRQDQLDFDGWVADEVHALGLKVFMKNSPDKLLLKDAKGRVMADLFDGLLNEECAQYKECSALSAFTSRGKPVIDVEYTAAKLPCSIAPASIRRDRGLVAPGMKKYLRRGCP